MPAGAPREFDPRRAKSLKARAIALLARREYARAELRASSPAIATLRRRFRYRRRAG